MWTWFIGTALCVTSLPDGFTDHLRGLFRVDRPAELHGSALLVPAPDGSAYALPSVDVEAEVEVTGFVAHTRLRHGFHNPTAVWLEATYVHPLPERGAVDGMRMQVGERVVEAVVQEKAQARRTYEAARAAGQAAALSVQLRPDLYATSVAHIPPGGRVVVELSLREVLSYEAGAFVYRLPMPVQARYAPPDTAPGPAPRAWTEDPGRPARVRVHADFGVSVHAVGSPTHAVRSRALAAGAWATEAEAARNEDFVLRWQLDPRSGPVAAAFAEAGPDGWHYAAAFVVPPSSGSVTTVRDLVFVVDTSGSMAGPSMAQAKAALVTALDALGPRDRFEIVAFDDAPTSLFGRSQPATAAALDRARAWVRRLRADGGTRMAPALERAFDLAVEADALRQVVFLTDGAVDDGARLLRLIGDRLQTGRLFTVGIGPAPNAHLMRKAAREGRGTFTFISDPSEVEARMQMLFERLSRPAAVDLVVTWDQPAEALPESVPDLYYGEPVVVLARSRVPVREVVVAARIDGRRWRATVPVRSGERSGVGGLWARWRVDELMARVALGAPRAAVRPEVVRLGLAHRLVTPFTSLVSVDVTPRRPADAPVAHTDVPTVAPVGAAASTQLPRGGTAARGAWLMAALVLAVAWMGRWRRWFVR
jgi:Ca-activated chloride channel family protein